MKKIRWGIIGCGDVTEVKSGPGFQKAEGSELAAVMRRNGALAEDYAARHGVPAWYNNADSLIEDPAVDAVYIATPPAFHKEYTLKAATARKPIYVEKPMALHYEDCREMVDACRKYEVPLFVAYYRRALPKFLAILDIIKSGEIGDVRCVHVNMCKPSSQDEINPESLPWRVLPVVSGGGYFMDLGSHTFDLLDFYFGPVREVRGFSSNQGGYYPAEDIVTGSWVFESGVHGTGTWCFTAGESLDQVTVFGSRGSIRFSVFEFEPIRVTVPRSDGSEIITREVTYSIPEHAQQPLIQTVVRELLGETGACPSTGESGLRSAWVLDALK